MQPLPNQRWNSPPPSMQPRFSPRGPPRGPAPYWGPRHHGNHWAGGHPGAQLMNLEQFGTPLQQRFPMRPHPPRGQMPAPPRSGPPHPRGPHPPRPGVPPLHQHHHTHQRPQHGPGPRTPHPPHGHFQRAPFMPGQGKKIKKEKVDKRDLPENNKFYCDSCDRGYKDEDKFQLHMKDHKQCPHEGCPYIAAAKLVALHVKLQHSSGMAKKIWTLESQEDIQKWREERKKNYPTAEIVAKKKALLEERIARGEVIEEKYFGKMRQRGQNRGRGRGRGRWQNRGQGQDRGQSHDVGQSEVGTKHKLTEEPSEDGSPPKKQLKTDAKAGHGSTTADGLATAAENCSVNETGSKSLGVFFKGGDSSNSDSDSNDGKGIATPPTSPTLVTAAGALGSLITAYSDSEEDGEKPEERKVGKQDLPSPQFQGSKDGSKVHNKHSRTSDDTASNDTKDTSNGDSQNNNNRRPRNQQRTRNRKGNNKFQQREYKLDKSLLEKLLAKEIRQERNKIMQCVHYIVKHNFFDEMNKDS